MPTASSVQNGLLSEASQRRTQYMENKMVAMNEFKSRLVIGSRAHANFEKTD